MSELSRLKNKVGGCLLWNDTRVAGLVSRLQPRPINRAKVTNLYVSQLNQAQVLPTSLIQQIGDPQAKQVAKLNLGRRVMGGMPLHQ